MEKKIEDYLHLYLGCEVETPDGIGKLVGLPYSVIGQDRVRVHFGKEMIHTKNSIDGGYDKQRNHGEYAIHGKRYEPIKSTGRTVDGFDVPGGIKPILRPLSDMTDKEMLDLIIILMSHSDHTIEPDECDIHLFHNDDGLMVDEDIIIGAEISVICFTGQIGIRKCGSIELWNDEDKMQGLANQPMAFAWILKKGFDLFGLIDAGLAIDKTRTY